MKRIEDLHSIGFIHSDIKFENILIGKEDPDRIYLIDFGLSRSYENKGLHINCEELNVFSGNLLFASFNSCAGSSQSRRDDVESVLYLFLFLLNNCLPWKSGNYNDSQLKNKLNERAQNKALYIKKLYKDLNNGIFY